MLIVASVSCPPSAYRSSHFVHTQNSLTFSSICKKAHETAIVVLVFSPLHHIFLFRALVPLQDKPYQTITASSFKGRTNPLTEIAMEGYVPPSAQELMHTNRQSGYFQSSVQSKVLPEEKEAVPGMEVTRSVELQQLHPKIAKSFKHRDPMAYRAAEVDAPKLESATKLFFTVPEPSREIYPLEAVSKITKPMTGEGPVDRVRVCTWCIFYFLRSLVLV